VRLDPVNINSIADYYRLAGAKGIFIKNLQMTLSWHRFTPEAAIKAALRAGFLSIKR